MSYARPQGATTGTQTCTYMANGISYSSGNVGINTTTPHYILDVSGNVTYWSDDSTNNNISSGLVIAPHISGPIGIRISSYGLSVDTPFASTALADGYALYVDGSANFTGTVQASEFNTLSDRRIKKGIASLDSTFTVDSLSPKTYYNIRTKKQDIGFIADDLQKVYPYLVTGITDGEALQSVNYIGLIGVLTKEIQTLKALVSTIQTTYATTSALSGYATTATTDIIKTSLVEYYRSTSYMDPDPGLQYLAALP
jgi:hypothetical protein